MTLWIRRGNILQFECNLSYDNELQINWMYELGLLMAKTDDFNILDSISVDNIIF